MVGSSVLSFNQENLMKICLVALSSKKQPKQPDEIRDIRSGSRILRIGEDPIYVADVAAH